MDRLFDCVIVGSGPGGMTAALYMCRAGYKTALITGAEIFGSLGKINVIENYPGINSISGFDLANSMYLQLNQFNSDLLTKFEFVNAINYFQVKNNIGITLDNNKIIFGTTCIFAMGGEHNLLGIENEETFFGNGISFCATCDGPLYKDKKVAVIGGGNSAMDFAISLSKYCKEVDVIHRRNELRATKFMIDKVKKLKNVNIILNTTVKNILSENNNFIGLLFSDNTKHLYDGCFYALGFKQKQLTKIKDDNYSYTDNIFYAGDCIDTKYRQVITACGDGCKAALNCIEYLQFLTKE